MTTTDQPSSTSEKDLISLPKAELHLHLEGAMRRTTLVELCEKNGISPIPPDTQGQRFDGFSAFVDVYIAACECLREPSDVKRLMLEVVQDAKDSGATWVEIAPSFTFYADRFGGPFETLKLLAEAAEEAEKATGVGLGLVVSIERQLGVEAAETLARLVQKATSELTICGRRAVVGFGVHGPEEGNPPAQFANAFEIACGSGDVASLPHAGEIAPSPGQGVQSVIDAVTLLKAQRIGHGVLAYGDEDAMKLLQNSNVCLDVCPSSNYLLMVVPTIESHPIAKMLESGVPCSINADDPLLFGCTLAGEYEICRKHLCMDDAALAKSARYSFQYSRAPESFKTKNLADIDQWLSP
jgi:adenosine deaminase